MNVSGTWSGEYIFDESACDKEARSVVGHAVHFEMTLQQGWLGMLSGKVQDDARTGYPEEGKIKGKLKGEWIEFRRLMPVLRLMNETGRVTLERWAERRKVVLDTDRPSPPLLFQGKIGEDGKTVAGTWKLEGFTIEVPGSYLQEAIPSVGGSWSARLKA